MAKKIIVILAMFLLPHADIKIEAVEKENDEPLSWVMAEDIEEIRNERFEKEKTAALERAKDKEKEHKESSAYRELSDNDFKALVSATYRLETGNGTSTLWLTHNNAGGIKCGATYCRYGSEQEGLEALENLLVGYVKRFGYDFEAIRSVYSESDDTALFTQIYNEERGRLE